MERIVLGYDGSPASGSALSWVARRVAAETARVGVVNVVARLASDRESALAQLAEAETYLREHAPGVAVELHRLEGSAAESLTDFADDADLLVVGINPGHPIRAAVAGALPLKLSTKAHVPVTMVPAGWVDSAESVTVGIASDGSSAAALAFAVREAKRTGAGLRLVHSWLMPTPSFAGSAVMMATPETVMGEHREVLEAALTWVLDRQSMIPVQTELIRDSRSAALLRFASRSSMLVIGTHRRGLLAGSLLGSVAQEVLWHAECPVTVVPADAGPARFEEED